MTLTHVTAVMTRNPKGEGVWLEVNLLTDVHKRQNFTLKTHAVIPILCVSLTLTCSNTPDAPSEEKAPTTSR